MLPGMKIAALFVQRNGCYYDLEGVDPWDEQRDARLYPGPHPVVAHPPCQRWGNYWYGSPSSPIRLKEGDDDGCFAAALDAATQWGGVIEHPAFSSAWAAHQIAHPPIAGGWVPAGLFRSGWTCSVEQGHYGHRARKATWLYVASEKKPRDLIWGPYEPEPGQRLERLSKRLRAATPVEFRDLLIGLAREC